MDQFYLDQYLEKEKKSIVKCEENFLPLCERVKELFFYELEKQKDNLYSYMDIQKKAIIGYENEVTYFKEKIRTFVKAENAENVRAPSWYENLTDGIYHENWGLAGIAQWYSEAFCQSSSAKIIGERIYYLEDGHMVQKPQTISKNRREQMIRAFLLLTPDERMDKEYHEIYLLDGTRVTIFGKNMTKQEQDVIIFRRYIIPQYTFEEQAKRGTIPFQAIPLFQSMVRLGYNVVFTGAVRTAKTTFLSTWQSYEDSKLEGVMVETDPEIPLHQLMPQAPIVQLLADDDRLSRITKNLLRSDADYFIFAEARDGNALDTALRIAAKGTKRMKLTFHTRDPMEFPMDVAIEIIKERGGELNSTMLKVAQSFDFIFHFVQLKDKNKKRLKGIYELNLEEENHQIRMKPICLYDYQRDGWHFFSDVGKKVEAHGLEEDVKQYNQFKEQLECLSQGGTLK
ncbi:ATPase, T2SS/T4P/T4SS family [Sinanaerobacter sp. ZZT-01]|uniref:ATPase, T2SS/T4P/T4SS family n=1 Tax=Sinanaerobacter sp. ZZT-01 TaxID=3111540 RepID=UPI002D799F1E|nr:ATPase, T2SS/T4P/T4SS family [Sinanaerobacter sp. ZZT-01]WRR92791.1 ATPase, T2SS/T4P/T4SS family [Sinanaerobacter sp. ZZT-01]